MEDWTQTLGAGPLLGIAAGAVALILFLVIRVKLHAFLVLVIVSLLTAVATGIPAEFLVKTLVDGFGGTLGNVALLIGFGAVLGRLIESSGGAKVVAEKMVSIFGEKRAAFALGVTSLLLGFPIFFDAGLIVMLPIIFAVARRIGGKNLLLYGIAAAGAFSVMHVFVPPHPGPVAASEFFGANLGVVLLIGLIIAFPVWYVTGYLWAKFANSRNPLAVPALFGQDDDEIANPPSAGLVIGIVGAVIGGFLLTILGFTSKSLLADLITATVGAMVLLAILRSIDAPKRRRRSRGSSGASETRTVDGVGTGCRRSIEPGTARYGQMPCSAI